MKSFFEIRNEAYADMLSRKEKLHSRSNDAYKKGDLPTMNKAHSLAMKQNKRIQAKYPDEDANRIMSGASKDYQGGRKYTGDSVEYPEDTNVIGEGERGLWDNIHAKRKRIKAGSGERMRKPGSKGAPTAKALRVSAESTEFDEHLNGVSESNHHYDDAQEHLTKATTAEKTGKEMDFHGHMADHHDSLSQWHESKGRGVSADKHASKSEEHSERYTELAQNKPSEVKEGVKDLMSNTLAKPKSRLSLSAMRNISRKTDTKNKMPKVSSASNDTENTNASLRLVRAEEKKEKKDNIPFDGPYTSSFKKPNNPNRTGMDSARALAQRAMDQANKKKPVAEEKEKTEYDYEGDMARGQLQSIISNAQRVHDMLEDNTNIAEWVQSKITLAEDYISTVANYMMSEIDEAKKMKGEDPCWDDYKMIGTKNKGGKQVPNCVPEEVEHTDESRQVYYINSHKNQDPAVAQAKKIRKKMSKPKMLNLKMGESYSARDRLAMALNNEKKKREDHEAAQAAREAAKQAKPPEEKIKEGIASLISKNIKPVTATKLTPQQKADIRLNK